ncbi:MAG TPA: TlpA disulfide reductase family protein, partial [Bacteroidales bacterium]|nr:TlpA disulfide reductase family protein [Bacteroidales bacterium]
REDVHANRYATVVPATPFSLLAYITHDTISLDEFKGKVILLTYWFPGCGPCRGEFPNFENVIRKFKGKDVVYLAINIAPEQDEYVVPFVRSSGYSFIPLKDEPEKRGNLTARGAPTNYLLDRDGNIIFKNFRTDDRNERTLELMIQSLLE